MNTSTLLLLLGGAYLLFKNGGLLAPRRQVPVYSSQPGGGTVVTVPNVGRYATGPAGTQITIDPSFFTRLFGRGTGEPLPAPETAGVDTPVFPPDTTSFTWSMGGALDAYRAGERDPQLEPMPTLEPTIQPDEYFTQTPEAPALMPNPCEWDPLGCAGAGWDVEYITG